VLADPLPKITSDGGLSKGTIIINHGTQGVALLRSVGGGPNDPISAFGIVTNPGSATPALGASNATFAINPTTGVLSFKAAPASGTYTVTAGAEDSNGGIATQALTIKGATGVTMIATAGVADTFVVKPGFGIDFVNGFVTDGGSSPHSVLAVAPGIFGATFAAAMSHATEVTVNGLYATDIWDTQHQMRLSYIISIRLVSPRMISASPPRRSVRWRLSSAKSGA